MIPAEAANTLASATSPYLRQHADNPVHWQQWSPEALADAAARDKPILLSVGYAACHWCHVMAHESFEDDEVAAVMNAEFVCIKVDREERPDIDAVYMNATVALTGQGGWPMTCFLTPDGRPFFCGTYYPKDNFLQVLSAVASTWRESRDEVEEASDRIAAELRSLTGGLPAGGPDLVPMVCDRAVAAVLADEDTTNGGFGGAPKFPPSAVLEALLRNYERTGSAAALSAAARAGEAMARGGIYDQLGGGFARYSVDEAWAYRISRRCCTTTRCCCVSTRTGRGAPETRWPSVSPPRPRDFCSTTWRTAAMFTSSLDADADGREGSTYVWMRRELSDVLGDDDGRWAADLFTVTRSGTFEDGASVLQSARRSGRSATIRPGPRRAVGRPSRAGPSPGATARSSPPGTGWRSPRWRRPALRWTTPD